MKLLISLLMFVASASSWAGTEVPWPLYAQQNIQIREIEGMWVSQHLDNPQLMYYFTMERAEIVVGCPLILRIYEINSESGAVISQGSRLMCSNTAKSVSFVMYDEHGRARNQVRIVGLIKPVESEFLGAQLLGFSVFSFGPDAEVLAQDTFYKFARVL